MDTEIIIIKNGRRSTYYFKDELYQMGFKFNKQKKEWSKEAPLNEINGYKEYAKKHLFRTYSYPKNYERGTRYREDFFKYNKPVLFKKYYICAYCGRPLRKQDVSVDHIIPVNKAKKNPFTKMILRKLNIENINEPKNLVASCKSCNSRKGTKLGIWLLRGYLGKFKYFWIICYPIILFILGLGVTTIWTKK